MPKSVFTDKYNRFREMLVDARRANKLTQAEVARKLGKPQSFVSKYELGERRLDVVEFLEVARALKVNVGDLLGELDRQAKGKTRARK